MNNLKLFGRRSSGSGDTCSWVNFEGKVKNCQLFVVKPLTVLSLSPLVARGEREGSLVRVYPGWRSCLAYPGL